MSTGSNRSSGRGPARSGRHLDIGAVFSEYLTQERSWEKLFHEFCAVAARDEEIGSRFRSSFRMRKEALVRLVEEETNSRGVELALPAERLVMGICALFSGIAFEKLIDPGEIDDALFGEMLGLLAAGALRPGAD